MVTVRFIRGATFLLACSLPVSFAANVQKSNLQLPPDAVVHKAAVQKIFTDSYAAYKKFAFGHDDLSPLSEGFSDGRNGWGASIVDAMTTMHIMGLDDLFAEAVNFSSHIDFSKSQTPDTVSVFETTIRYLGGLVSAYELSDQKFPVLLEKAKEVADKMAFAWVGSNIAEAGTVCGLNAMGGPYTDVNSVLKLSLEWSTLSSHTGNQTYSDLSVGSLRHIANLVRSTLARSVYFAPPVILDLTRRVKGLAAQGINPATGAFVGGYVSWGGGSDSYFEYLIKYARLSNTDDPLFADTWHTAVDSSIKTLLRVRVHVCSALQLLFRNNDELIRHVSSHLACFHGGNWIYGLCFAHSAEWEPHILDDLGGKLLNNDTIVNFGLELVDACWNTYASTATGIGPEAFSFISSDGNFTGGSSISSSQANFNAKNGFYITSSAYILRPEVLESNFYAWRATGDTKYLDRAASAVASFNKFLQTSTGYAGLNDVNNARSTKIDDTESFWFAEVLKYLYLTFDDPEHISLDNFVFNTEAHPFKAPSAKASYGTQTILPAKPFTAKSGPPLPAISPSRFMGGQRNPQ
ncbi:hypothetical protein DXG01_000324 [Tephrocybe rancida]|nr:hypothetical protein DXG01_000324 [Tephrocybe rancida]